MRKNIITGNQSTGALKLIALACMLIDHMGSTIFKDQVWLRIIGRIAFPLYCWCMVVGFEYTRNWKKYLMRLLGIAVLSQPLCVLVLNRTWLKPNIFITLALALCALWGVKEKWHFSHLWAPVAAATVSQLIGSEYGWKGVALIVVMYLLRGNRWALSAGYVAFCFSWQQYFTNNLPNLLGHPVSWTQQPVLAQIVSWTLGVQAMAILALPLILIPFRKNIRMPTVVSYLIYPAHLVVLWGLQQLIPH